MRLELSLGLLATIIKYMKVSKPDKKEDLEINNQKKNTFQIKMQSNLKVNFKKQHVQDPKNNNKK